MARISAFNSLALLPAGAAALTLGLTTSVTHAAFESFEDFTGASGSTVHGYTGDGGAAAWASQSSQSIIIVDGDAYHGDNFLRIDDNGSGQVHQTANLADPVQMVDGGSFSFALRKSTVEGDPNRNTNSWLIFKPAVTDGVTSQTLHISWNEFALPVNNTDAGESLAEDWLMDVWYLHEIDVTFSGLGDGETPRIHMSLKITAPNGDVIYDNPTRFTFILNSADHTQFSGFNFFTGSSANARLDMDAISIVPEPASLLLLGAGGLLIAARRQGA